ncbi:hypothetical protein ACLBXM_20145 [Xanthobacteraceae bacterium A53D]
MAIKSILDSLDDAPEALRGEYKQIDGKFVLDVEGIDAHPTVVNLKSAHERQKAANKTLTTDLAAAKGRLDGLPDDFDADAYEVLKGLAEGKDAPKTDEQVARVREQLERKHQTEIGKREDRIKALEGQINKAVIDDGLGRALDEAGIDPKFKVAAKAVLKEKGIIKLSEDDGAFSAVVETDMGPMPLGKFVGDWASGDEGKIYVAPPKLDNANPGDLRRGEVNPFAKDHWNKSGQGAITDPAKAERLAKAAGFRDLAAARGASRPIGT